MSDEFEVTPEAQAWFDEKAGALKAKNDQVTGRNVEYRSKIEAMEAEKKGMLDKFNDDESRRLFDKGDFEAAFNHKFQASLSKSTETIMDLERQLTGANDSVNRMKIQGMAQGAALAAGVRPDAVEMMMLKVSERYRINDGAVIGYGDDGTELFNDKGESLSMSDYIGSLHSSMGYMFTAQPGSGANGQSSATSGQKKSEMSREAKSKFVETHGYEKFMALPA